MGFSAADSSIDSDAPLARPLYRDDDDGMQALRLQHFLSRALDTADRARLNDRLHRAMGVTEAQWAAVLIAGDRGVQVYTAGDIPPSIHRQLGELRLHAGQALSFPAYLTKRAASQGFSVEGAMIEGRDGPQGCVVLGFRLAERQGQRRIDLVRLVADDLSGLIDNIDLGTRMERIKSHLSLVHRLGQQVTSIHDRAELFEEITRLIQRSLGYEHIQLLLTDDAATRVELAHASGPLADRLMQAGFSETIGRGIIGRVAETGRIRMSADVTRDNHFISHAMLPNTASELALPLRLGSGSSAFSIFSPTGATPSAETT